MPENSLSCVVHTHYLDKVAALATRRDVFATEVIFDQHGHRLAERGQRFTPLMRDALLRQTLKKPLETCLAVEGGLSPQQLLEVGTRVIENCAPVASLVRASEASLLNTPAIISAVATAWPQGLMWLPIRWDG